MIPTIPGFLHLCIVRTFGVALLCDTLQFLAGAIPRHFVKCDHCCLHRNVHIRVEETVVCFQFENEEGDDDDGAEKERHDEGHEHDSQDAVVAARRQNRCVVLHTAAS